MKKTVSVILVVVFLCLGSASVLAENVPQARYTGIMSFSCSVETNGVLVTTSATLTVWKGYTSKATAELQEKGRDGVWRTVANYEESGSSTTACVIGENHIGVPGRTYRAFCVFTAYNSNGTEVDHEERYTSLRTL